MVVGPGEFHRASGLWGFSNTDYNLISYQELALLFQHADYVSATICPTSNGSNLLSTTHEASKADDLADTDCSRGVPSDPLGLRAI